MAKAVHISVESRTRYLDENERLIKKFIKKTKKSGLLDLVKNRRFFEKKSSKMKRKRLRKRKKSQESTQKYLDRFNN